MSADNAAWKTPAIEMTIRAMREAGVQPAAIRLAIEGQFRIKLTRGQMNGYLGRSGLTPPLTPRTAGEKAVRKASAHRQGAPEPAVDAARVAQHDRAMARPALAVTVVAPSPSPPAVSRRGTQYAGFSMLGGTVKGL